VPTARAGDVGQNPWILSRSWDFFLFTGSPLVAIAVLIPAARFFPSEDFAAFLLAFLTFGHHLPGFLRAYGDRDLFRRRRIEFLLAPPLTFAAALLFARRDLHGLLFVVFTWDIWHVLMQQYGFLRIYDAKAGCAPGAGAWADRIMALSWYLTFIAWSPHYTHNLLLRAYSAGLPAVTPAALQAVRTALALASAAIAVWYVARLLRSNAAGGNKLLALGCFLAATWYLYVIYPDFTVGFAVWSAFHCMQYYGIVWAFNRRRVESAGGVTGFLRLLFQAKPVWILVYAMLILGYGGINWLTRYLPKGAGVEILMAFIVTSGTLHYYYDGFIWRVREPETQRWLSIGGRQTAAWTWSRFRHPAVLQAVAAAAAVMLLAALEWRNPYDEVRVRKDVASSAPGMELPQRNYASALRAAGRYREAAPVFETALSLSARDGRVWHEYGLTLAALGRLEESTAAFERAAAVDPDLKAAHYNLASILIRRQDTERALRHYRKAFPDGGAGSLKELENDPAAADALSNLALGLVQTGERAEALVLLRRVVEKYPRHASARLNLASLLAMSGDIPAARTHYRVAMEAGDEAVRTAAAGALEKLR
jgi:tetratricopeptide (TPR) repeat protein